MYCLRHKHRKGKYLSKDGDFCNLDTERVLWHDAWITVAEAERKRPELEGISAIKIIKELQEVIARNDAMDAPLYVEPNYSIQPEHAVEASDPPHLPYGD